ncbi:MAG: caspase family protein [Gemmataceae bacterium]|nr:caspase family protein [Gemmataceae bacterium]
MSFANGPILRVPASYRRRARRSWWLTGLVGVSVVAMVVTALAAFHYGPPIIRNWLANADPAGRAPNDPEAGRPHQGLPSAGAFPRRVLAISVNHYLYANPVSYGIPGRNVRTVLERLARALHIPSSQLVELSDGAAGSLARPTLKPVIEKTIADFLDTSRAQDRIVLLFIGHAVTIDEKAYLVPLEGDLQVKETLIPLDWLYNRLAQCKARQKVLILDVCRFDPGRGLERPGSGPMSASLAAALHQPPPGVQLWTACAAEQYSYEFEGVGVFLDKLLEAVQPGALQQVQQPTDALPVDVLAEAVHKSATAEVQTVEAAQQTPRRVGQEATDGAPYDARELLPAKLVVSAPPPLAGGLASPSEIQKIVQEIDLPPLRLGAEEPCKIELLPFSAQVLVDYRPDYQALQELQAKDVNGNAKFPLRAAVLEVIDLLQKSGKLSLREKFSKGGNPKAVKEEILKEQMLPARILGELTEALEKLQEAGKKLGEEPSKRWQAHYHYIHAQLLARLAFMNEYNLMLGKIRKDELPELKANVHTGWRLAAQATLQSGKDVRDRAEQSRRILAELAQKHPGTPWEVLAKRDQLTARGLGWQPAR